MHAFINYVYFKTYNKFLFFLSAIKSNNTKVLVLGEDHVWHNKPVLKFSSFHIT